MKTKDTIFFVLLFSFSSILYGFSGELYIKKLNGNEAYNVHVSTTEYVWSWDNNTNKVFLLSEYSKNFTGSTSYTFDAPKSSGNGSNYPVMPWGLINFNINSSSLNGSFTIDFRDEGWSQNTKYSSKDTYILIDFQAGIIYLSKDQTLGSGDIALGINTVKIWEFWNAGGPIQENFKVPVTLYNKVEGTSYSFGQLTAFGQSITSGEPGYFYYTQSNSVSVGSIETNYNNQRKYNFKWTNINATPENSNANLFNPSYSFIITNQVEEKSITRNFRTVWPLTIKNNLIESNQSSFGSVWFKDPTTTNEFELKPASGDGYVNNEAFNNLNEIINNQPNQKYSVKAVNSFSEGGRNYYWYNGDFNPTSGTDILVTGETTRTANFKGTQLSNDVDAFNTNSQRKFVRTTNGDFYQVYTSLGTAWLEKSTDNGQNWDIMNNGKPLNT